MKTLISTDVSITFICITFDKRHYGRTNEKPTTRNSASKSNIEESESSSDESVEIQNSDRKMAVKSPKTKTKISKAKSLTKDPPNLPALDNNQVELLQTVPAPYPAKPARKSKKLSIMYYKQKAHYFQKKFEGATSDIGVCSDISYSSSE